MLNSTFVFALLWFALTFLVHLAWWRIRRPRRQTGTLLKLLLAALPVGLLVAWVLPPWRGTVIRDFWDVWIIAQFHVACSLAYTCINSAIQEDAPSLLVTTFVSLAGPEGCTADDVRAALDEDLMLQPRLAEFTASGMIELRDGRYVLTERGRKFRHGFEAVRILYRLPRGG